MKTDMLNLSPFLETVSRSIVRTIEMALMHNKDLFTLKNTPIFPTLLYLSFYYCAIIVT